MPPGDVVLDDSDWFRSLMWVIIAILTLCTLFVLGLVVGSAILIAAASR
jgi:hypothetical protein